MTIRAIKYAGPLLSLFALACSPPQQIDDGGVVVPDVTDTGYPAPRNNLYPRIGRDNTLDIATWNIENFPANSNTAEVAADIITSLDIDLLGVQEIASESAWEELIERLPDHGGILSNHTYSDGSFQKVGFIYKRSLLTPSDTQLLFQGSGYEFPRPPLKVYFTASQGDVSVDFTAVTLHLKAGPGGEDRERRRIAINSLESFANSLVEGLADDDVILLGDFNEVLTSNAGRDVFSPFLNGPYQVISDDLATGEASFLPGGITLDHIITTDSLVDELGGRAPEIPQLNREISGFQNQVSDHLPVVISFPVF